MRTGSPACAACAHARSLARSSFTVVPRTSRPGGEPSAGVVVVVVVVVALAGSGLPFASGLATRHACGRTPATPTLRLRQPLSSSPDSTSSTRPSLLRSQLFLSLSRLSLSPLGPRTYSNQSRGTWVAGGTTRHAADERERAARPNGTPSIARFTTTVVLIS